MGKNHTYDMDEEYIISKLRAAGCVFAEDETRLLLSVAKTPDDLTVMLERRVAGYPLEYIIGWTDFCGLRIAVEPGVFVPRHRTEFLVQQATVHTMPGAIVVDLCCGTGAIGAALANTVGPIELHAVDVDPQSVRCAYRNVAAFGGHVYEGDLYEPLPAKLHGRVDMLVANAPYVPTEAIKLLPREAREYEVRVALDGGKDGLAIQRRIAKEASYWLVSGGHILVETSQQQSFQTVEIFAQYGLRPKVAYNEECDATVVMGTLTTR